MYLVICEKKEYKKRTPFKNCSPLPPSLFLSLQLKARIRNGESFFYPYSYHYPTPIFFNSNNFEQTLPSINISDTLSCSPNIQFGSYFRGLGWVGGISAEGQIPPITL